MELKLARFINRYSQPCMWEAGICTAAGIVFHHLIPRPYLASPLFCLGALLAGFPILYRAIQGLRFKTVGIECLVSTTVHLPMSMKELAAFLSTTPETLSRRMKSLEEQGFLKRRGRQITLLKQAPSE